MFNIILRDYKKNYAFDECSSLSTVNYMGTIEQWNQIKIDNLMNDLFFH